MNESFEYLPYCKYPEANKKNDCVSKPFIFNNYMRYMLNRTLMMFDYDGLPKTMNRRILELQLQTKGVIAITDTDITTGEKGLYSFFGGIGGEPDVYYEPTNFIIANPKLKSSKTLIIGTDCEIIRNDSLMIGMLPLFKEYSALLTENVISIYIAEINTRLQNFISVNGDNAKKSAEKMLSDMIDGKISVLADSAAALFDGVKTMPYGMTGQTNVLNQLIELQQYLKSSWLHEIGIQSNFNMKREAINGTESGMNEAFLKPLIDDMLTERIEGFNRVNEMFGTNISVKLNSAWADLFESVENELETESESEQKTEGEANEAE